MCVWSAVQEGLVTSDIVEGGLRRSHSLRRVLKCLAGSSGRWNESVGVLPVVVRVRIAASVQVRPEHV